MADGQVIVHFKTDGAEKLQADVSRVIISLNQLEAMSKYKTLTFANISQELMKAAQSAEQMENSIREASKIKLGLNVPSAPVSPVRFGGGAVVPYAPALPVPQRTTPAPVNNNGLLGARQGRLAGLSELEKLSPALSKLAVNLNNFHMKINGLIMLFARLALYFEVFNVSFKASSAAIEKVFDLKFATNAGKLEQAWNIVSGKVEDNLAAWRSMNERLFESYKEEADRLGTLRALDKQISDVSERISDKQTQRALEKLRESGSSEQVQTSIDSVSDKLDALAGERFKLEKQRVNLEKERAAILAAQQGLPSFENIANMSDEERANYEKASSDYQEQILKIKDESERLATAFEKLDKTSAKYNAELNALVDIQNAAKMREQEEATKARMKIFDEADKIREAYARIGEAPKSLEALKNDFAKLSEDIEANFETLRILKTTASDDDLREFIAGLSEKISELSGIQSQIEGFKADKAANGFALGGRGEAADALSRVGGYVAGTGGNFYNTQSKIERNTRETANAVKLMSRRANVATYY